MSDTPIDPDALKNRLGDPAAGACCVFEGWVRNMNEGQPVQSLAYEAYGPLAEKEGNRILEEARERWPLLQVEAVHRTGHLQLGDLAVWVGVASGHRDAAFAACRFLIDTIKARVPIWKKEYYVSGASQWINCTDPGDIAPEPPGCNH
ncbi:MAG: molybdenum cofactor biosynthesis protein MoaE [Opitutales bacterium]